MTSQIKKYNFRSGLPLEFEIIDLIDLFQKSKDILSTPHRTNFYHIIWIQEGFSNHIVDFKQIRMTEKSIFFVTKDCVHSFDKENNYKGKIILFTDSFFAKNPNDLTFLQSTVVFNDLFDITQIPCDLEQNILPDLFSLMENEYYKPIDKFQHEILRNYLFNFLLVAEREKIKQGYKVIKPSADLDYVLLFKDLLEKNFASHKKVNQYASDLSISEKRLYKATTQIFGKSPKDLIDERLLLEIKRLLAHNNSSIKEIAYDLGFDEPTYFIKYFKKHTNTTPTEFRESFR